MMGRSIAILGTAALMLGAFQTDASAHGRGGGHHGGGHHGGFHGGGHHGGFHGGGHRHGGYRGGHGGGHYYDDDHYGAAIVGGALVGAAIANSDSDNGCTVKDSAGIRHVVPCDDLN